MNEEDELQEWATVFDTLGMDPVRDVLFEVTKRLDVDDEPRVVIEFCDSPLGYRAMEITDHVDSLEGVPTDENELDEGTV